MADTTMTSELNRLLDLKKELLENGVSQETFEKMLNNLMVKWTAVPPAPTVSPSRSQPVELIKDHNYTEELEFRRPTDVKHSITQDHHDYFASKLERGQGFAVFTLKNVPGTNTLVKKEMMDEKAKALGEKMGIPGSIRVEEMQENGKGTGVFALVGPKDFINAENLNAKDSNGDIGLPTPQKQAVPEKQAAPQQPAPAPALTPEQRFRNALQPVADRAASAQTGKVADALNRAATGLERQIDNREKQLLRDPELKFKEAINKANTAYLKRAQGGIRLGKSAETRYEEALDKAQAKFEKAKAKVEGKLAGARDAHASLSARSYDAAREERLAAKDKGNVFEEVAKEALKESGINFSAGMDAVTGAQINMVRETLRSAGFQADFKTVEGAVQAAVTPSKPQAPHKVGSIGAA